MYIHMAFEFMPGATVVGISHNDGVLLVAEREFHLGTL